VIPPIFASSLLLLPTTIVGFAGMGADAPEWVNQMQAYIGYGRPGHMALYAIGIIFFCFFYTSIVFNPEETAENLRKYGGFIPGYRPGKRTAEHLDYVLTRLTVIGSIYIAFVCVLPEVLRNPQWFGALSSQVYIGGTSILIVVSVTMDTVAQIQSHLIGHQYEGMIKRSRLGGKKK
jgi:preprotein translocase subunit SecY